MRIAYVSEFVFSGSGYTHISQNVCTQLVACGHEVTALGIGYKGEEHHFPFGVVPITRMDYANQVEATLLNLKHDDMIDHVMVALDVPMHEKFVPKLDDSLKLPYSGIFPIEAPPVTKKWAMCMSSMENAFVISDFGMRACHEAGATDVIHLPIAVDIDAWRPPTLEERQKVRGSFGFTDEDKVILTVADNQERKNLPASFEIVSKIEGAIYLLVTRTELYAGWNLTELAETFGIRDRMIPFERGISFARLWGLFAAADAFLITSKAEGLGMPVLEAMSMGVPIVAPMHTAFKEHLSWSRGYLFDGSVKYIGPFGNEYRYLADVESGVKAMKACLEGDEEHPTLDAAHAYIKTRTWDNVKEILCSTL
jgi:glycosyltransferase involved in cell wall biosynthesis